MRAPAAGDAPRGSAAAAPCSRRQPIACHGGSYERELGLPGLHILVVWHPDRVLDLRYSFLPGDDGVESPDFQWIFLR